MQKVFNPEFLNRLDDVIVFHPLSREHIAQIVTILLREVQRRLGDEVRLTQAAVDFLVAEGVRRELRRPAAQAGDPEVRRGPAEREDPDGRVRPRRRDRGGCRARRRAAGVPGADRAPRPDAAGAGPAGGRRATPHPVLMQRFRPFLAAVALLLGGPAALVAQEPPQEPQAPPIVDSIVVEGNSRLTPSQIIGTAGLVVRQPVELPRHPARHHQPLPHRPVRRRRRGAARRWASELVLALKVKERPVLERWAVRGVDRLSEGSVKGRVKLVEGRPLDRNAVEQSRASIDSLYKEAGYYAAAGEDARAAAGRRQDPGGVRRGRGQPRRHQPGRASRATSASTTRPWWARCPPAPRDSGGSRRASTTRTSWSRTCARSCRAGTPTGASWTSRSPATPWLADSAGGKATLHLTVEEGPQLFGGHLRHRGEPAVLHRRADGVLPVRAGEPGRGARR